jgi:hypothetical protein
MLTRLIFVALCLLTSAASADSITKTTQKSDSQFAARYLPNAASTVVHVASAHVWGFERPVIVAFYEYPVTFSDNSKNYGDNPDDKEVLGIAFLPVNSAEYRKFEIQGYGPEGATAQINSVFFSNTDNQSDKKLFVMVSWHTNAGVLYSTYAYEKPQLNSGSKSLVRLEKLSQTFGMECDYCPNSDQPNKPARYKTAADVKAELKRRMK